MVADQVADDHRLQRVQLPTLMAVLGDVAAGAAVGQLRRVGRRVVGVHLIHIESEAVKLDAIGLEGDEAVGDVAAHVLAARIVISEVQEDDVLPLVAPALQPAGGFPHFRLRDVPAARKMVDVEALADLADDADQGVLLDPHLHIVALACPVVEVVGVGGRVDDAAGVAPVRITPQVARPVLDGLPVDQAAQPGVADKVAEVLVAALVVGDDVAGDHLIVDLAKCEPEALPGVVSDDGVDLLDQLQALGPEVFRHILNFWHCAGSSLGGLGRSFFSGSPALRRLSQCGQV